MNSKNLKVLDCTFRDGGYHNNWMFSNSLVKTYVSSIKRSKIDYVEIGFRSLKTEKSQLGELAYSEDKHVDKICSNKNLNLGVMLNASDFLKFKNGQVKYLKKIFNNDEKSKISFVRIACHENEIFKLTKVINFLKEKNYKIGINIMQISEIEEQNLIQILKKICAYNINFFYFADSTGSLNPSRTKKITKIIKSYWKGDLGFHAHDNMGLAHKNLYAAIKYGVNMLDATILGMGRGPGNVKTLELLRYLNTFHGCKYNVLPIKKLTLNSFTTLKNKYKWGTNKYYYLSGKYSIHPTYIQEILNSKNYSNKYILNIIEQLKKINARKFDPNNLDIIKNFYSSNEIGKWSPRKFFHKKNFLIIGGGNIIKENVEKFINSNKENLNVLVLNFHKSISEKLIDFRVSCHPLRITSELNIYKNKKAKLIAPISSLSPEIKNNFKKFNTFDYGLQVIPEKFKINTYGCILSAPLVLAYSLSVCAAAKANKVFLIGFDSYKNTKTNFNNPTRKIILSFKKKYFKNKIKLSMPTKWGT